MAGLDIASGMLCNCISLVTASMRGTSVGFTCQTVSISGYEPPLVAIHLPFARVPPRVEPPGQVLYVNLLASDQSSVAVEFDPRHSPSSAAWRPLDQDRLTIDGALMWLRCRVRAVHRGDSYAIAVADIEDLWCRDRGTPLLHFNGQYRAAEPSFEVNPDTLYF